MIAQQLRFKMDGCWLTPLLTLSHMMRMRLIAQHSQQMTETAAHLLLVAVAHCARGLRRDGALLGGRRLRHRLLHRQHN
jgi:hypothetical protein